MPKEKSPGKPTSGVLAAHRRDLRRAGSQAVADIVIVSVSDLAPSIAAPAMGGADLPISLGSAHPAARALRSSASR
jgi:hypothetical protein